MTVPMRLVFCFAAIVALLIPSTYSLSLSDFQPINGFSKQCTQAYDTPLSGCSSSDFQTGKSCSTGCISFLEALTTLINTQCKGTSAFPNTLIGLFFAEQGTKTLCPNVLGTSGDTDTDGAASSSYIDNEASSTATRITGKTTSTPSSEPSSSPQPSSSEVTSSVDSAAATSTSTDVTSTQSAAASSTTSSTEEQQSTSSPASSSSPASTTPSSSPARTSASSKTSKSHSSSSTSTSSPSPSPNNSDSGGDGTILDLGSSASSSTRLTRPVWTCLLGLLILFAWLP